MIFQLRLAFFSMSYALFMGSTITLFRKKKNFKFGLTVLFTHLKIILLQYFQFSIISNIQTDPKVKFSLYFSRVYLHTVRNRHLPFNLLDNNYSYLARIL